MVFCLLLPLLFAACQSLDPVEEIPWYPEPMDFGEMTEGNALAFALMFEGPGTELEHSVYWNINGLDRYPIWLNGSEIQTQGEKVRLSDGWLLVAVKNLPIGRQVPQMDLVSPHGKRVRKAFSIHVKAKEPDEYTVTYGPVIGVVVTHYPPGTIPW